MLNRASSMVMHVLQSIINRHLNLEHFRRHSLHFSLVLFIIVYSFCGGLIFHKLERDAAKSHQNEKITKKNLCIAEILQQMRNYSDEILKQIESCWKDKTDETAEWNYVTSTLYGFGLVTTLGYNRIAPITTAGRMLSIVYGILGIPITMIAIAITGRKLNTLVVNLKRKLATIKIRNTGEAKDLKSIEEQKEAKKPEEMSSGLATFVIFITFSAYVVFGAILLPLLNGEADFINGLYYNFLCLTAIDFGQLIPRRIVLLPITFAYICAGLALTTIAIDDGSKYARRLQHLGEKIKNVAATKIWFGGKTLRVGDILHAVGEKWGIESSVIDKLDLDTLVQKIVDVNEGKVPEEPPRKESFKMNPCFAAEDAISMMSEAQKLDPHSDEKMVATQVFKYDEFSEAFDFAETKVMALVHEEMIKPSTYMAKTENRALILRSDTDTLKDPRTLRTFEEKKKQHANDARNLFKVYEDEWKRIEHLTMSRRQQASNQSREGDQPRDDNKLRESDQPRDAKKLREIDQPRDDNKPRESDQPRDGKKPPETDQPPDDNKPRETDQPLDGKKPPENDQPLDGKKPHETDQPRDNKEQREIDQPQDSKEEREIDQLRDDKKPRETDQPRDSKKPRETDKPREKKKLRESDELRGKSSTSQVSSKRLDPSKASSSIPKISGKKKGSGSKLS